MHLYFHRHMSETCTGMCNEKLLGGSIPLNCRIGEVEGYQRSFNIKTSSVTKLHLRADLHIAFPGTSQKYVVLLPTQPGDQLIFFCPL